LCFRSSPPVDHPRWGRPLFTSRSSEEFKDEQAKGTREFAQLIRDLRARFHLNSL
jgi:hypothetical protein